jgi:hypothetical protein
VVGMTMYAEDIIFQPVQRSGSRYDGSSLRLALHLSML